MALSRTRVMEGEAARSTTDLVRSAAEGDEAAWATIIQRYSGLLWHVVRGHRLEESAAADVVQTTWLRLVQHLRRIRDPEALGGWLATTARREALAALHRGGRERPCAETGYPETVEHERGPEEQVLKAARDEFLWQCVRALPERDEVLLRMLVADPPLSYAEISIALDMPIGSIGPTRARCLDRLRRLLERKESPVELLSVCAADVSQ